MSGRDKLLVDTSVFIFLFQGNKKVADLLKSKLLFYSFITEIELLGVVGITNSQKEIIKQVLECCEKISYTEMVSKKTISIKQKRKVKIPDAIIAASAIEHDLILITADTGFTSIPELDCILFEA